MEESEPTKKEETGKETGKPGSRQKKLRKPIHDLIVGDYLSKESVVKNLPFLGFIAFLAIIYIANTYYSEKTFKQIERTKTELKELRYQYITTKAMLMYYSKQSEIAKRSEKMGLKETVVPPYKIFYNKDSVFSRQEVAKQ